MRPTCSMSHISTLLWIVLFTWISGDYQDVQGTLTPALILKARCYSNCLTSWPSSVVNVSQGACETPNCKECIIPCGESKVSLEGCKQKCGNSRMCKESCRFINFVKNFSSPYYGDGSRTSRPEVPTVSIRSSQSITLRWPQVTNSSGTPVYLVGMTFTGDFILKNPYYFNEVYTSPFAVIPVKSLCFIKSPFRTSYKGIAYKFDVVAITGNGSVSFGTRTSNIEPLRPDPVKNVTLAKIEYDVANPGDKLNVILSWLDPNGQKWIISKYAFFWKGIGGNCRNSLPRTREFETVQSQALIRNGSVYLYERLKECLHQIEVYAINDCIPSNATTIQYTYPGCRNISSFPRDVCYDFDPPQTPIEDRMVRNLTHGPIKPAANFTFAMNVSWIHPVYPYKEVTFYLSQWGRQPVNKDELWIPKSGEVTTDTHLQMTDLFPNTQYRLQVRPYFSLASLPSKPSLLVFTTPEPDPADVKVQNPTNGDFLVSLDQKYQVTVTWQKPLFPHSVVLEYVIKCATLVNVGGKEQWIKKTKNSTYTLHDVLRGEKIAFEITPRFSASAIKGKSSTLILTFPGPRKSDIQVQDLAAGEFVEDKERNVFSVSFSWTGPSFSRYAKLTGYNASYQLAGYPRVDIPCSLGNVEQRHCIVNHLKRTFLTVSDLLPQETVNLEVSPLFAAQAINREVTSLKVTAPEPRKETVKVIDLRNSLLVPTFNNSYSVSVSWKKPPFNHSTVKHYKCKVIKQVTRHGNNLFDEHEFDTYNSSVLIDGISANTVMIRVQITPVFVAPAVRGEEAWISIFTGTVNTASAQSCGIRQAVTSDSLTTIVLVLVLSIVFH